MTPDCVVGSPPPVGPKGVLEVRYTCTRVHTHTQKYTQIYTYKHKFTQKYIHINTYRQIHTHVEIHTNIYIEVSLVAQRIKHLPARRETSVPSLGQEDPLEKEMATHSRSLAWRIPWMEEPGGLQPTGSQRVGHD